MTTKGPSRKQIIISMNNNNKIKFMASLNAYITNINSTLRNIKSDFMANFVHTKQYSIIITTNKIATPFNLQTIEDYVKNVDYINSSDLGLSCLP